jgi:hypothetical protein|tara:strand:+ start:797 stop:1141 length:345 start_codon:yes stop_codon:yes gene_type:complete
MAALLGSLVSPTVSASTDIDVRLLRAQWPAEPSTRALLELEPIQDVLKAVTGEKRFVVRIRHAPDEAGGDWGSELMVWLIAFGIPQDAIALEAGAVEPQALQIWVEPRQSAGDE